MTKTPEQIESEAVERFKAEWAAADAEGDEGNRVRRGLRAAGLLAPCDLTDETIERGRLVSIPRIPFGPKGVPEDAADADYYRDAARSIRYHAERGNRLAGSNVTEAVAQLCDAAADALAAARVAPVTPSQQDCLCYGADGVTDPKCPACQHDRDALGICERCGGGLTARDLVDGEQPCPVPAPSPDREKLIERKLREFGVEDGIDMRDAVAFALSLAVPPVVNAEKVAEIIGEHVLDRYDTDTDLEVCACAVATEDHEAHVAAVLVERQREWQGTAR